MLSKEQIEEIKTRAEKATPGEWEWEDTVLITENPEVVKKGKAFFEWCDPEEDFSDLDWAYVGLSDSKEYLKYCWRDGAETRYQSPEYQQLLNDREFVAKARTDIPALLAHIEYLEAQLKPKGEES